MSLFLRLENSGPLFLLLLVDSRDFFLKYQEPAESQEE